MTPSKEAMEAAHKSPRAALMDSKSPRSILDEMQAPCTHAILAFVGNNKGVYCTRCKVYWRRTRYTTHPYHSELIKEKVKYEAANESRSVRREEE